MEKIKIAGSKILFEQGLPGFEHLKLFLVNRPIEEYPFFFLQSLEEENVSFLTVNPYEITTDYEFDLPDPARISLDIKDAAEVAVLNIINTRGDLDKATVNLQAPVIINVKENKGMQVVLSDSSLNIREPLKNLIRGTEGE